MQLRHLPPRPPYRPRRRWQHGSGRTLARRIPLVASDRNEPCRPQKPPTIRRPTHRLPSFGRTASNTDSSANSKDSTTNTAKTSVIAPPWSRISGKNSKLSTASASPMVNSLACWSQSSRQMSSPPPVPCARSTASSATTARRRCRHRPLLRGKVPSASPRDLLGRQGPRGHQETARRHAEARRLHEIPGP